MGDRLSRIGDGNTPSCTYEFDTGGDLTGLECTRPAPAPAAPSIIGGEDDAVVITGSTRRAAATRLVKPELRPLIIPSPTAAPKTVAVPIANRQGGTFWVTARVVTDRQEATTLGRSGYAVLPAQDLDPGTAAKLPFDAYVAFPPGTLSQIR